MCTCVHVYLMSHIMFPRNHTQTMCVRKREGIINKQKEKPHAVKSQVPQPNPQGTWELGLLCKNVLNSRNPVCQVFVSPVFTIKFTLQNCILKLCISYYIQLIFIQSVCVLKQLKLLNLPRAEKQNSRNLEKGRTAKQIGKNPYFQ